MNVTGDREGRPYAGKILTLRSSLAPAGFGICSKPGGHFYMMKIHKYRQKQMSAGRGIWRIHQLKMH